MFAGKLGPCSEFSGYLTLWNIPVSGCYNHLKLSWFDLREIALIFSFDCVQCERSTGDCEGTDFHPPR